MPETVYWLFPDAVRQLQCVTVSKDNFPLDKGHFITKEDGFLMTGNIITMYHIVSSAILLVKILLNRNSPMSMIM